MDWRDSNIILGEQMNTRGYDSSKLLPSHKGVGILRPDGESDTGGGCAGDDSAVALHAQPGMADHLRTRPRAAGGRRHPRRARRRRDTRWRSTRLPRSVRSAPARSTTKPRRMRADGGPELPEPLASVVDYLGEDLTRGRSCRLRS